MKCPAGIGSQYRNRAERRRRAHLVARPLLAGRPTTYRHIVVTDFSQTLSVDGRVRPETVAALSGLRDQAGCALVLATGDSMFHLMGGSGYIEFPELREVFHAVVADGGGLVANPRTGLGRRFGLRPSGALLQRLAAGGVAECFVGDTAFSVRRRDHDRTARVIKAMGLDLVPNFDGDWATYLPAGIDKLSAIRWLVWRWGATMGEVIGLGNGANDAVWLAEVGIAAAVANAEQCVKDVATIQLAGAQGYGVVELAKMVHQRRLPPVRPGTEPPHRRGPFILS